MVTHSSAARSLSATRGHAGIASPYGKARRSSRLSLMAKYHSDSENCGQEIRKCECGHDAFDHRQGPCGLCDCQGFVARLCRNKRGRCPNHDVERYQRIEDERSAAFEALEPLGGEQIHRSDINPAHCGIYFIQCESFVKIGLSLHVRRRMFGLRSSTPFNMELIGFLRCPSSQLNDKERELHGQFAALRHRNEWFRLESPILEYIESLKAENRSDAA